MPHQNCCEPARALAAVVTFEDVNHGTAHWKIFIFQSDTGAVVQIRAARQL